MYGVNDVEIKELVGKTFTAVSGQKGGDELVLTASSGERYRFYHDQNCCESVLIEDIAGDLTDLIESPLLSAEESTNRTENPTGITLEYQDSFTWTFYKFQTAKGHITVRWYGSSNGYYGEDVSLEKIPAATAGA